MEALSDETASVKVASAEQGCGLKVGSAGNGEHPYSGSVLVMDEGHHYDQVLLGRGEVTNFSP